MTQWKSFMLLFMGLFCKVSMKENMTQVFFFVVENDLLVKDVVKNLISSLSINVDNLTISNATISTECEWKNDDTKKCWCMKTYSWSSDACLSHKCCNAEACTLQHKDKIMCVKDDRVTINGSTTFPNYTYNRLFNTNNEKTEEYDKLNELMTNELKNKFSKIPWFYTLVITGFRSGSVIADYTVQFHGAIKTDQLMEITNSLNDTKLVTKGLVTMKAPKDQPVGIGSNLEFSCTKHGNVKWVLFNERNETLAITHGTQAQLNSTNDVDTLKLTNISASWKGLFTCEYTVGPIKHIASEMLDIAILADISARSQPQFPDCTVPGTKKEVTIQCSTPVSKENYNVSWSSSDLKDLRRDVKETKGDLIIYKAIATIRCEESTPESVNVTCTFTNDRPKVYGDRKSSTRTLQIQIIRRDSKTCPMDTDWPKSKSSYTAVLDCDSQTVGEKTRKCSETGWEAETSSCVKVDLQLIHNEIKEMAKGLGYITENADRIVEKLKTITTTDRTVNSYANIDISVDILKEINDVSVQQSHKWNDTIMPNFVSTISNILNDTQTWNQRREASDLSVQYLQTVESMVKNSNLSSANHSRANVQLLSCNTSNCETTNASVTTQKNVVIVTFTNLADILPQKFNEDNKSVDFKTLILLVTPVNGSSPKVNSSSSLSMNFKGMQMSRNHEMYCVYWNESGKFWSSKGCEWGGASNPDSCKCTHNSAFTIMMSKEPITLPYMETLTYVCLGVSIVSLVLCILIEFLVWDKVVKSNIASFRHIALVNIAAWLLFAYCAFLATTEPKKTNSNWCLILTVVKHYCFLAVFFWTLCLSFVLLHQLIFIFEQLRKKIYITLSIGLGYVCPLLCVASAYVHFDNGEVGKYYSNETCWLTYESGLKGSIFAFIFPVGTIVIINMFALFVVITKIVTPAVSEVKARDEKAVAKSIIKTIVFLSPILGITWILGFLVFMLDLTQRPYAQIVNYAFTILNSLQGFFILLTNCFGEKKVREALSKRFGGKPSVHSKSDSSTKMTSVIKKK